MSDENRATKIRYFVFSWTTVLAFLAGIVIPLLAAAIPQLIDYLRTRDDFQYTRGDPVHFDEQIAYWLEIKNKGQVVERSVEVWIGVPADGDLKIEFDPLNTDALSPIRLRNETGYKVVSLGDMRSNEKYRISILTSWKSFMFDKDVGFRYGFPAFQEKVVSRDRVAKFVPRKGSVWDDSRPWIPWYTITFAVLTGLGVILGMSLGTGIRKRSND